MVKCCYDEIVEIVVVNWEVMDCLVEMLIEKEIMDGDEFKVVVGEFIIVFEKDCIVVILD